MKFNWYVIVFFFLFLGCEFTENPISIYHTPEDTKAQERVRQWNYIYSYAIITQPEWLAVIITEEVLSNVEKQRLDPYIVARLIWKETKYRINAVSRVVYYVKRDGTYIATEKDCAYGLFQVNLDIWKDMLHTVANGQLKNAIHTEEDAKKYVLYISYNCEMGTRILRKFLDMFDGNYSYALSAYCFGQNSKESIALRAYGTHNEYEDEILHPEEFEEKMRIYNNWKFVEKKVWTKIIPTNI